MAKVDWKSVLGWSDEQINDLRYLAYSYIRVGKYNYALTMFESLVALAPDSLYDLQTLGAINLELGNNAKALTLIEKALKLDPNHLPTKLNKVKAMFLLGYKEPATLEAKALMKCPDQRIAESADVLIRSYT
jgi:predicted Zn-dependent protease